MELRRDGSLIGLNRPEESPVRSPVGRAGLTPPSSSSELESLSSSSHVRALESSSEEGERGPRGGDAALERLDRAAKEERDV